MKEKISKKLACLQFNKCMCVFVCVCFLYAFRNTMKMPGNVFCVLAVTEIPWLEWCENNHETVSEL